MRLVLAAVLVALVAGCGTPPVTDSGIEGTATMGPTCPVERDPPDPGCADRAYEGDLVVTTPDQGKVVERFSTNAHGEFRVAVAPGEYSIRNDPASDNLPYCAVQGPITVEAGRFTKADVSCDTGIR
ncbi:MAG: hypothetical protein QOC71_1138 [Thermoplasmata archaeon]|nr:hypothetical protein [Thermoplasmata archaeon]